MSASTCKALSLCCLPTTMRDGHDRSFSCRAQWFAHLCHVGSRSSCYFFCQRHLTLLSTPSLKHFPRLASIQVATLSAFSYFIVLSFSASFTGFLFIFHSWGDWTKISGPPLPWEYSLIEWPHWLDGASFHAYADDSHIFFSLTVASLIISRFMSLIT